MKATAVNKLGRREKNKNVLEGDCVFPFKHKNVEHNACIDLGKGEMCATEVNPKTRTMTKYGYCQPSVQKKLSVPKTRKLRKLRLKQRANFTRSISPKKSSPKKSSPKKSSPKKSSPKKSSPKKSSPKRASPGKMKEVFEKVGEASKPKPPGSSSPRKLKKILESKAKQPKHKQTVKRTMQATKAKGTRKLKIVASLKPSPEPEKKMAGEKVYNEDFVKILGELEDIMTRQGEPFRARAYHNAAETIMAYTKPITNPAQLNGQPGIGKTIMTKLEEYVATGKLNAIEKYRDDPVNVLTKVYGIGPKKAKDLIANGIDSIEKLRENTAGLTAAQKLGVQYYEDINQRIPRAEIDTYKGVFEKIFKESTPAGSRFEIVGSYRRGVKSSGDIDIIITNEENNSKAFTDFLDALVKDNVITHILSKGKTKSLTIAQLPGKPARRVDLMYTPPSQYAFAILYFTGSKAFNTVQRQRALDLGYTLNEHGFSHMRDGKKGTPVQGEFPDEESIFKFLKMKYKSPAERIDGRSVEPADAEPAAEPAAEQHAQVIPDPQDLGKTEALQMKQAAEESAKKKVKRVTLKKKPVAPSANQFDEFKKGGVGFLKTQTEAQLVAMIKAADNAYYCDSEPLLSDDQYDVLREYTMEKYPANKEAKAGHTACEMVVQKNKVKLPYEMWSMDKIKPDSGALASWVAKYKGPYVLSCKLDGVSGLYTTEGAKPKLYTRGNGTIGQDVSHMIPFLQLPKESGIVIRGEFIIPKARFESKYADKFANPRNFVAGVVNQKKVDADKFGDIDFVAYEVIKPEMKPSEQMAALTGMDVEVVRFVVEKSVSNELLSELLVDWRDSYKYEIDGVICADDALHPRKRGNPEHAFAFKMVLGDQVAEVKVVDVIWTASKDGYLKPRVQVEPVTLGGAKIEYATGFNAKFIEDNKIGVGAVVKLVRSGDVIPHILDVVRPAPEALMPSVPYKWNETHVDIELVDKSEDSTVQEKVITGFFKGIGVDGMGAGIVKRIIAAGYDTVPKILAMKEEDFLGVEGFKSKLASKVYNGIHEKLDAASLADLMHATNIFGRGFGTKRFKAILEENPDILVSKMSNAEKEKLLAGVSGMAKKSAAVFVEKIPEFIQWAKDAGVEGKLVYTSPVASVGAKAHPLYGKKIVMTGFRDKELAAKIEKVGGENSGSVSKNTFVVLVKDVNEDTGKADQARKLGVKLMTPEQFKDEYGL